MSPQQMAALSAALRHTRDARALLASSPDQAWHLAGFGPECIRKACLQDRMFDKVIGHDWTCDTEEMLDAAVSLDARAWRYRLHGWAALEPHLGDWRPPHCYDKTGSHAADAQALVEAAERLVARVHAELWMDGELKDLED
jgi:hypothetical protein